LNATKFQLGKTRPKLLVSTEIRLRLTRTNWEGADSTEFSQILVEADSIEFD